MAKPRSVLCSFKRYERKYLVSKSKAQDFLSLVSDRLSFDAFCVGGRKYRIYNIYFDTDDFAVIRESVSKPAFKEKARFRAYDNYAETGMGFLEIKRKIRGVVVKRRIALSEPDALRFVSTGVLPPDLDGQMARELKWYFDCNDVGPRAYISYDRMAFFCTDDKNIRVTFDDNILYRTHDVSVLAGDDGQSLLPSDICILELKFAEAMPVWMASALSECEIYPHSFSKYGNVYKQLMTNNFSEVLTKNAAGNI